MNVFQELFTTKLIEKLWPSQNQGSTLTSTSANSTFQFNNFTESFFEKVCLVEFENSIYNSLKCSKILYKYYEQVVLSQGKMLLSSNKSAGTIQVNPMIRTDLAGSTDQQVSKNILNKKLSLTLLDFGKPTPCSSPVQVSFVFDKLDP